MTENYHLTQNVLPEFFQSCVKKNFFFKQIGPVAKNVEFFIQQDAYLCAKEDLKRMNTGDKTATLTEEEKAWKYENIKVYYDTKSSEYVVVFIKFPPDFVKVDLDAISIAVAMKGNPSIEDLQVRFFILEMGNSPIDGRPEVFCCERDIATRNHINHEEIQFNENFMANFANSVFSCLNSKE